VNAQVPEFERAGLVDGALVWSAFARSVRDNVVAEAAIQIVRILSIVILARVLTPRDFGLFRILLVVGGFAAFTNEAGIPDALIQRKRLSRVHETTAWWMNLGLAGLAAMVLWTTAPLVARLMAMPALAGGIRLLAIPMLLEGTAVSANVRLQRSLRFSALAAADVAAEVLFLATAVSVFWFGYSQWSLPAALGVRFATHAVALWIAEPRAPIGMPRLEAARDLARFATTVSGGRLVYILSSNADYLLVGRLLGTTALGFYSIAWDLLRFVPDRLHRVAGRVTLPAFCHFQDDNQELARAYRDFFGYAARIVLPLVACVVIAAPELVGAVYGPQWRPAAQPLRLLACGLALAGMRIGIGSVYYSKDHPSFDLYLHGLRLVLIVCACLGFARTGLNGVSAAMSVAEGAVSIVGVWLACRLVDLRLSDLAESAAPAVRLALVCAVGTAAGKGAALMLGLRGPLTLALIVPPPAITYCWLEAPTVVRMVSAAFGRVQQSAAAVDLSVGRK
jgi:O-antigen/teichoic acid export membrane protein